MSQRITIIPENPATDGLAAGKVLGATRLRRRVAAVLRRPWCRDTLGAMGRTELERYVHMRLETPPDYRRYPELTDLHPERVEFLRGVARGAGCSLAEAALDNYLAYRAVTEKWYRVFQIDPASEPPRPAAAGGCSGVLLVGPDGILAGQNIDSVPPPRPPGYRHRTPPGYDGFRHLSPGPAARWTLRKPRTGYWFHWQNERGVAYLCGGSCGVWLDEPYEDTWPIASFPFLRFAQDIQHLAALQRRYSLFFQGKGNNSIFADPTGRSIVVEKSNRRVGIRESGGAGALWCTEGHFESPEMYTYLRAKRLDYVARMGRHLGCGDLQYATDCSVRFTHLGELCHAPWGRGYAHLRRILADHAAFPRAVCRHGGPDTDPYDLSVTLQSCIRDLGRRCELRRDWVPWKKFCCETPEQPVQFP